MPTDAWLPIDYALDGQNQLASLVETGDGWQIWRTRYGGFALLATPKLADRWVASELLSEGQLIRSAFGELKIASISVPPGRSITALQSAPSPGSYNEAVAFADALRESRAIDAASSFRDGIYIEMLSRILPTVDEHEAPDDGLVLGKWLTGGLSISAAEPAALRSVLTWLPPEKVQAVTHAAGLLVADFTYTDKESGSTADRSHKPDSQSGSGRFELPGRPDLETFFNDHVVDIVQHPEHYRRMGIGNPSAIILEGPPGTGKTFAVDKLATFLGWPKFSIDASSIGSPFIHETSRKVSELFLEAIKVAPAIVVIDEMEAFLPVRDATAGQHHRVEEVAEFLRRIPEAVAAGVLIVGMTNRLDMIDPAASRRGRFDHVIHVGFPSATEVKALLDKLVADLPIADGVNLDKVAAELAGRPLSDAAFVVREAARISAKDRQDTISPETLQKSLASAPARDGQETKRRIGF